MYRSSQCTNVGSLSLAPEEVKVGGGGIGKDYLVNQEELPFLKEKVQVE